MRKVGYLQELKIKKDRRRKLEKFVSFFIPVAVASLLIYFFLFSDVFKVKNVEISVNPAKEDIKIKTSEIILSYLDDDFLKIIKRKDNIFLINESEINSLFSSLYLINEVKISKNIRENSVKAEIYLRDGVGVWCDKDRVCFKFDNKGFLFERIDEEGDFLVKDSRDINLNLGDYAVDEEFILSIINSEKIIDSFNPFQIEEYLLPEYSIGEFWIKTKEGWLIYLDKENDLETQIAGLKNLLEDKIGIEKRDELEYVDLRIDGRMYYRLREAQEQN